MTKDIQIGQVAGFRSVGIAAGIKKQGLDLGLIVANKPVSTAAVFTQNSVVAAPVTLSRKNIADNKIQAIVVNSGNANCMTAQQGHDDARAMADTVAELLNCNRTDVIVSSTGIIGVPMPTKTVIDGIKKAYEGIDESTVEAFSHAILTTDLTAKTSAVEVEIDGKTVTIAGCAKGSGMIEPNMATMLGFLTTDVAIDGATLDKALREAIEPSFNSITVDGCTSTNDMVCIMASGEAKNSKLTDGSDSYSKFVEALTKVCTDLALKVVKDGEGASCLIEVKVKGAETKNQARKIAKLVANSPLVKTAANAEPPNWGRIAQAVGQAQLDITEDNLKTSVERPNDSHVKLLIETNLGNESATVYTCDFTEGYIKINTEYN